MTTRISINAGAKKNALRWGILGLGHVGSIHTWAIKEMGHMLGGFTTNNPDVQSGDATKLVFNIGDIPGPLFFTEGMNIAGNYDYKKVLRDPNIDAVIIAAPTKYHVDLAIDAALADKHCFLEKPMAMTYEESQWIMDAFSRSKGKLVVGHVLSSFPEFELLREEVLSKGLKNVSHLEMTRRVAKSTTDNKKDTVERGGFAIDLGMHDANFIRGLGQVTSVRTTVSVKRYDQYQWLQFKMGLHESGKFVCNVGARGDDGFHHSYHCTFNDDSTFEFDGTVVERNGESVAVPGKSVPRIFGDELEIAARYFRGEGDASFLEPIAAQDTLKILEAAAESAKSRKTIKL